MADKCEHQDFAAHVSVGRIENGAGVVTSFMADAGIKCAHCGREFQFLGLEPGLDMGGARVSVDGLEARLAICPQGEQLSPLDRIAVNFPKIATH